MTLPVSFTFNGVTDGTTLVAFNAGFGMIVGSASNLVVYSERAQPDNGSNGIARWNGDTFASDHYVEGTYIENGNNSSYVELYVRLTDGSNFVWIYLQGGNWEWGQQVAGVNTSFGTGTYASGDVFRIEAEGASVRLYRNAVQVDSATTTLTGGGAGMGNFGYAGPLTGGWDTWEAGDLGAAAASYLFRAGRSFAGLIVR